MASLFVWLKKYVLSQKWADTHTGQVPTTYIMSDNNLIK
jgi:hypothetical protein